MSSTPPGSSASAASTGNAGSSRHLPAVDGLRAVAVLSVIAFHFLGPALPGGFTGVDMFFVISGYVVSLSLAQDAGDPRHAGGGFRAFAMRFYARRLLRLYPALVLCLVATALAQTLLVPQAWLSETSGRTGLAAFAGLSNFALIRFNDGYFSPRVDFNPFTHTWSLAVEEQFYLIYPALFFLWWRRSSCAGLAAFAARWLLAALLAASLAFAAVEGARQPDWAYYLLPSRFWELALGALLFRLHVRGRAFAGTAAAANGCIGAGLALMVAGMFLANPRSFPWPWALLPTLGTLLVIAGVAGPAGEQAPATRLLNNRVSVYLGQLSYSLYLWHWPVAVMLRWTVGLERAQYIAAGLLLTLLLGAASFHAVERPLRHHRALLAWPPRRLFIRGAGVAGLCTGVAGVAMLLQPALSLSVTRDRYQWYPLAWPAPAPAANDPPPLPKLHGHHLFMFGDSHAGALHTLAALMHERQGMEPREYMRVGCAVANLQNAPGPRCQGVIGDVLASIAAEARAGDVILLSALRLPRLSDQWVRFDEVQVRRQQGSTEATRLRAEALTAADDLVARLEGLGLTVVVEAPPPLLRAPPFRCSDAFNAANPICRGGLAVERKTLLEHRRFAMESIAELKLRHPGLVVWDAFPVLCPGDTCTAFDRAGPLFFDGDHLSAHGNRVIYPSLVAALREAPR